MPENQPNQAKTPEQDKVLCMFSGGLDSLGALYLLLSQPEYKDKKIHVHHMVLKNIERRALVEKVACNNILSYFKDHNFREFEFTQSMHDMSFLKRYFVFDSVMYGFVAANMVMNDPSIVEIAIGSNADDRKDQGSIFRANKGRELFHHLLNDDIKFQKNYIFPVSKMSKLDIWRMLPKDLRKLAWSCRRPVYKGNVAYACKKCKSCKEMEKIKKAEAQSEWAHPLGLD